MANAHLTRILWSIYYLLILILFATHPVFSQDEVIKLKNIKIVAYGSDPVSLEHGTELLPSFFETPRNARDVNTYILRPFVASGDGVDELPPINISQEAITFVCQQNLDVCRSNEFVISFELNVLLINNDRNTNIFNFVSQNSNDIAKNWMIQFILLPDNSLLTTWNLTGSDKSLQPDVKLLKSSPWYSVYTTIKLHTMELDTEIYRLNRMKRQVNQLTITNDDQVLKREERNWDLTEREIPTNMISKVDAMNFQANAFVRYDFRNRLKKDAEMETLTIDFELPMDTTDGLIWFIENNDTKSYVYLKESRLHYTYVVIERTGRSKHTLTEEIYLNTPLMGNMSHALFLFRDKENLTLTLNKRSHASKSIDGRVPLIPSDGYAFLGGSENPTQDTDGKVTKTFQGRITKAHVAREGDKKVDLLQVATDVHWQDSVTKNGPVNFDMKQPRQRLIIAPTASKPLRPGWTKGSGLAFALTREPIPITFMGTQSSVVRFDTWDFTVYRSFEMEFMTYEPNGILFFVGPDLEHTDFVCLELFDGNVYFVYAVGDHYRHIQLNPSDVKVNNGMSNRVYVSRNERYRFLVKFNDRIIDVDQGTLAHQTEFSTYTYIGSVDQPSRLPWHVWSRENFAGCISSIRVNDDKFLDPSSRMSQHTDVSRGIQFGVCRVPDRRCNRDSCGGGQCVERSYPFFEPLNFACDCSGSDKTYPEGVGDIRRSVTCFRDSPILEMDGEMVLLIDFERQMNTLTTHTDDISLQFKTQQSTTPLFYAVSPTDKSYFRVDLSRGRIRVQTNINYPDNRLRTEEFFVNSAQLNDNVWHTLRIRRRAEYLAVSVDGGKLEIGKIPLQSQLKTFKLVAQHIYLGSSGPADFARPPAPTAEVKILPSPRISGEFRNFYWNEYDFIGTRTLPSKYTTDMLTPRAVLPVFPQWPREQTYSITLTSRLNYGHLHKVVDIKESGDMWLIEFKTEYEGVLLSAKEPGSLGQAEITMVILNGRLHVVYSIYGSRGVYQVTSGPSGNNLNDGQWHRVVIGLERRRKLLMVFLDSYPPMTVGNQLDVNKIKQMNFFLGGLPEPEWQNVVSLIRTHSPASLHGSEAEHGKQPAFTGCLGGLSLRSDAFSTDLLRRYDSELSSYPPNEIIRGFCREQRRCTENYCHRGRCEVISDREIRCLCTGTGFEGPRCETEILECPPNYCNQRGTCRMINGLPKCDCTGSGYVGERCDVNPCLERGGYCRNRGVCNLIDGMPRCNCRGTGYHGDRCQDHVCSTFHCSNRGRCVLGVDKQPICNCTGTGFTGDICDRPGCTRDMCGNEGRCQINVYGDPECDCTGTGFKGPRCGIPICTVDDCSKRGRCFVDPTNQPRCDCRGTGYTGENCQISICTAGYCSYRGRCTVDPNDQPVCDCTGTGYGGSRCSDVLCRPGFCENNGHCYLDGTGQPVCSCKNTGHTGDRCQSPICPRGHCLHGGVCSVDANNEPVCNCTGTEHKGARCEVPICTPGHCLNGGLCRVESGNPVCDCSLTNYQGVVCETSICPRLYCGGRGLCVVRRRQPTCDCHSSHHGERCELEVCPQNYCINEGFCTPGPDKRPLCNCPANYEGDRCEVSKLCPPDYCFHGGRCTMMQGVPYCDCLGTDYAGPQCEIAKTCPPGFCQNQGRCSVQQGSYVCDCSQTGYRGVICNEPIACPPNYCLFGGICSVLPGNQYVCDCARTGRSGKQCEGSTVGIHISYEKDGYFVYPLSPPITTVDDKVTLGFKTYVQTGTLITFMTLDGRHWALKLRDGRVMVNAGDSNVYAFQMRSNDGHYHVIQVDRTGDMMIVKQDSEVIRIHLPSLVNPSDKSITYNSIHIAADEKQSDIFRGVIGGVYWNGRYPVNELKDKRVSSTGEVTIVLTPEFPILPPKPQPTCTASYCQHQGICYAEDYQLKCDCSNSGWTGARCERQTRGFYPIKPNSGAYVIYTIRPPKRTHLDEMRVAFQTWAKDGPIVRVVQTDSSTYDIVMINGNLYARFAGQKQVPIGLPGVTYTDGRMHVISVKRDNGKFVITVDGYQTLHQPANLVAIDGSLITSEIVLGADQQFTNTFKGVLGAFYWNGKPLIDDFGAFVTDASVMVVPGRQQAKGSEEVVVVLMPHLLHPIVTPRPGPPKPLPDSLPEGAIAGGAVLSGVHLGNVDLGAPILVSSKAYGGGAAGLNAGTGLMLMQAGGVFGMGGLVDALLAGLLLALLLLISALIWACWRCKPGCCPCCAGVARKSARNNLLAVCCAPADIKGKDKRDEKGLLLNGTDLLDHTYGHGSKLDLTPPSYGSPITPIQIDQPMHIPDQDIHNLEGMKVDSILITKNNKYFVTGSGIGPPKVWDSQSGEVTKIMEGNDLGCTDLHLACDDSVLVAQVVDEMAIAGGGLDTMTDMSAIRVKRLQLWHFATGQQMEMPIQIMCTATCLTRHSEYVVVARSTRTGPSILVWDLPANQPANEIIYEPINSMLVDAVTYINISHDDRLVLAGCQNEEQACYMIFDLAAHYTTPAQPRVVTFDAEVSATEIIGSDTAVTGTRKGELFVWNMHIGDVIRQIQITATVESGTLTTFPPHTETVHCIQLSEDRRFLVTGSQDRRIRVWTMPDERLLHTLEGHADDVLSVAISTDSELVVSGSWDGSILVWRIRDGSQICWGYSNIEILQVKISNDKNFLIALGERNEHRKLITLRVIRNRVRTTTSVRPSGTRAAASLSPPGSAMSPSSPVVMA